MNKVKLMAIVMIALPCIMHASYNEDEEKGSDISGISTSKKEQNSTIYSISQENLLKANAVEWTNRAHSITTHLIRSKKEDQGFYHNTFCSKILDYVCCKKSHKQEKEERKECTAALQEEATFLLQQALTTVEIIEIING
ncbi:MAG: hypothetical protein Q8Q60_02915 [Candidatus Chromulinivorax sp.]|nr:hypothetical protein [Candidatus Chromulinivorax sp.]